MATEKRLIYLEDAIAKIVDTPSAIAERVFNGDYGYDQNPDVLADRQHEIIDLLMDVPTVKVVHGRWMLSRENEISKTVWCTACGEGFYIRKKGELQIDKMHYCPNCGAKMDGDGNA